MGERRPLYCCRCVPERRGEALQKGILGPAVVKNTEAPHAVPFISVLSEDEQQGMTLSFHQFLADGEDAHIAARLGLQPA